MAVRPILLIAALGLAGCIEVPPTDFVTFPFGGEVIVGGISADLDGNEFADLLLMNDGADSDDAGVFVLLDPDDTGNTVFELLPLPNHQILAVLAADVVDTEQEPSASDVVVLSADNGTTPTLTVFPGNGDGTFDAAVTATFDGAVNLDFNPAHSFILFGPVVHDEAWLIVGVDEFLAQFKGLPRNPDDIDGQVIPPLDLQGASLGEPIIGAFLRPSIRQPENLDVILSLENSPRWIETADDGTHTVVDDGSDDTYSGRQNFFLPGHFIDDSCDVGVLGGFNEPLNRSEVGFQVPLGCDTMPPEMPRFECTIENIGSDTVGHLAVADLDGNGISEVIVLTPRGADTNVVAIRNPELTLLSGSGCNVEVPLQPATFERLYTDVEFELAIPGDYANQGRDQLMLVTRSGELFCVEPEGTSLSDSCTTF